jgi:hypothetical protein
MRRNPKKRFFVMKYDGTEIEQLTDNQWEDGGPAWQPHKANPARRQHPENEDLNQP